MSSKTIEDLRDVLFQQLERLNGEVDAQELERAKAISGIAKEINQSAKIEVDHLRVTGSEQGSGFLPTRQKTRQIQRPPMAMINNSRSGRT